MNRSCRTVLLCALPLVALVGCDQNISDEDIEYVQVGELRRLTVNAEDRGDLLLLIDPRSPRQHEAAHIPGSRNILLPEIDPERRQNPEYARHQHIIVYGQNRASAPARGMTKRLLSAKYDRVRMYAGGLDDWAANGYPIEGTSTEPSAEPTAELDQAPNPEATDAEQSDSPGS